MNQRAQDLMMGAPSEVLDKQLKELHIQVDPKVVAELKKRDQEAAGG
jgi:aspartyl-tRNA synthetase